MDDDKILALYRQRNEDAIYETDRKYGALLRSIARSILGDGAESHDCVNDTYLQVWYSIPPLLPKRFSAWLGRLVRNHAIDLWRGSRAQKRDCELTLLLEELDECLPSAQVPPSLAKETAGIPRPIQHRGRRQGRPIFSRESVSPAFAAPRRYIPL